MAVTKIWAITDLSLIHICGTSFPLIARSRILDLTLCMVFAKPLSEISRSSIPIKVLFTDSTIPVSYTHLDVYKRQLRDDIADCNQIRLRNLADPGKIRIVRDRCV